MSDTLQDQMLLSIRELAALQFWEQKAIRIKNDDPFKLVSGNYSPIYINCRKLISSRSFIDFFVFAARKILDDEVFDVVAGGETAGIPFAAFVARAFNLPMVYVRKKKKGHGISSRIEGNLEANEKVLLVEDLITDAGSKQSFIEAITNTGATINTVLVAFDRLQGGKEALKKDGVTLHSVTDMDTALVQAKNAGFLTDEEVQSVEEYRNSPEQWSQKRSLPFN